MLARHGPYHWRKSRRSPFTSSLDQSVITVKSANLVRNRRAKLTGSRFIASAAYKCNTRSTKCTHEGEEEIEVSSFKEGGVKLPTQGESLVKGMEPSRLQVQERERDEGPPDFAFLSVLTPS